MHMRTHLGLFLRGVPVAFLSALLILVKASAQVVTNVTDSGPGTLRSALTNAANGAVMGNPKPARPAPVFTSQPAFGTGSKDTSPVLTDVFMLSFTFTEKLRLGIANWLDNPCGGGKITKKAHAGRG
jgi:hypothetical protein